MCHSLLLSWKLQADPTRRDMNLPIGHGKSQCLKFSKKSHFITFLKSFKRIDMKDKDKCGLTRFMNACNNGHTDVVKSTF